MEELVLNESLKLIFTALASSGFTTALGGFVLWWLRRKTEMSFARDQADIEARRADDQNTVELSKAVGLLAGVLQTLPTAFSALASNIEGMLGKLVASTDNTHEGIQKLLTDMPIATDKRVGEVIKSVDKNGSEIRELIVEQFEKLRTEFKEDIEQLRKAVSKLSEDIEKRATIETEKKEEKQDVP